MLLRCSPAGTADSCSVLGAIWSSRFKRLCPLHGVASRSVFSLSIDVAPSDQDSVAVRSNFVIFLFVYSQSRTQVTMRGKAQVATRLRFCEDKHDQLPCPLKIISARFRCLKLHSLTVLTIRSGQHRSERSWKSSNSGLSKHPVAQVM